MNSAATSPDASSASGRTFLAWWLVLLLLGAAHLWEVGHRGVDPDELEHLHAAFCVSRGELPYRDFFEHHAPALYYLLQPLFRILGPEWSVLEGARLLSLACAAGTLVLTARVGKRVLGTTLGLPAAALLAATTIFHMKSVELRPDVAAMLLLTAALLAALVVIRSSSLGAIVPWWKNLAPGLLCALASTFTQKSVVPAAGIALGILCSRWMTAASNSGRLKCAVREAAYFVCGFLLVWGTVFGLFAVAGAAGNLWHSAFYQLLVWPVRSGRFEHLRPTLAADLSVWLAAGCELLLAFRIIRRRETWESGLGLIYVAVTICLLSLAVVKATYPQFYLLWFPWLVLLAVRRWAIWLETVKGHYGVACLVMGWLTVLGVEGFLIVRLAQRTVVSHGGIWDQLEFLLFSSNASPFGRFGMLAMVFIFVALLIDLVVVRNYRKTAVLGLAALGMVYGQFRIQGLAGHEQTVSRRQIEAVNARVPPGETVLDGFTGYGALRPHAYYFWWINDYSLALMSPDQRGSELLRTLQAKPPAAVLFDDNLRKLPPEVVDWLEAHYRPADEPLWLPK